MSNEAISRKRLVGAMIVEGIDWKVAQAVADRVLARASEPAARHGGELSPGKPTEGS